MDRTAEYHELKDKATHHQAEWGKRIFDIKHHMEQQVKQRESADHWKQQVEMQVAEYIIQATGNNAEQRKADVELQKADSNEYQAVQKNYQDARNEYETTGIELDAARNAASVHKTMLNVLDGQDARAGEFVGAVMKCPSCGSDSFIRVTSKLPPHEIYYLCCGCAVVWPEEMLKEQTESEAN